MKKTKNANGMYKITDNMAFVDGSKANIAKIQYMSAYASTETLQYNNHVNISKNMLSSDIFFLTNQSTYMTKLKRPKKTIKKVNLTTSKTANPINILLVN